MEEVYLSLGSNIGDRQFFLREALHLLGAHSRVLVERCSKFYETSPVGGVARDDFINLAVKISTTLEPLALLDFLHEIEAKLQREREIHWGSRTIDIDIIFYGKLKINEEKLVIPHQQAFHRLFVLVPLLELVDESFPYFAEIRAASQNLQATEQKLVEIPVEAAPQTRIEQAVREILQAVGEDPAREDLRETPTRVAKMYAELLSSQHLTKFTDYKCFKIAQSPTDQLITMKDIPFYSLCEHHLLPFFGQVHVAYIPQNGIIIGLSKIPRLVNFVSHKLSVQEKITREIAETLQEILQPKGVAVVVEARHLCVEMRGVKKTNVATQTSFFLGELNDRPERRAEFLESLS